MRSTFTKTRALVLILVLSFTVVPTASAALRDGGAPRFDRERIVRVIKQVLKKFGISTNSDQISVPKP